MDIHLLKNEQRLGSGEVEHGGGWVGGKGVFLMRGGMGSAGFFYDQLGRGSEFFHQS